MNCRSDLLQAEVLELRTSSTVPAEGVVVEAHLDQGRGLLQPFLLSMFAISW